MKHRFFGNFLLGTVLVVTQTIAQAASFTWDGAGNGSQTHDWNQKKNWGNSSIPGAGDIAIFTSVVGNSSTPLVDQASSISNIVYNSGAAAFTLGGSSTLTLFGSINNNGTALQTINTALALGRAQTWNANSGNLAIGGNVNNGGFALTSGGAANTTISGIISGSGALLKTGNGTLTLTRSNTFSGGMTISGGDVRVNNTTGSGTGTGAVILNAGSIGGAGSITGGLTINSGRISPGNGVGTFTTGNQTWNGGGMTFEINNATSTAGTGWDLLSINGTLNLSGISSANKFTIDLVSLFGAGAGNAANFSAFTNYQWLVVSTTGGITGFDASAFDFNTNSFSNPLHGSSQFMMSLVNGGNDLAITYVPEPSTIAMGLIGAALVGGNLLRRRNKK